MFRIKQLSERTGLSPSRIRYYERIGLLRPVERLPNGYRVYPAEAEPVLRLIVLAQEAGFSLEEMQRLLPPRLAGWDYDLLTAALQRKLDAIAAAEAQLAASKARLIAVCPERRVSIAAVVLDNGLNASFLHTGSHAFDSQ